MSVMRIVRPFAGLVCGLLLASAAVAAPLSAAERDALAATGRVGEAVLDELSRRAEVQVMLTFRDEAGLLGNGRFAGPLREARIARAGDRVLARVAAHEFRLRHRYRHARGMAGGVSARGLVRLLAQPDVERVDLDLPGSGLLDQARPLVGVDLAQTAGFSGLGVTVAVVDSGTDFTHPDLADAYAAEECFCGGAMGPEGCCPNGAETQSGPGSAVDDHGHGTNVSGIVASDGGVAPLGVAPDAGIVSVKVLDSSNLFCCLSDVVAALDWIGSARPDVDIVNLSLGTAAPFSGACDGAPGLGPLADEVDALHAMGIVVVAASGNDGSGTEMTAPACIANAVAVGAVYDSAFGTFTGLGCSESTAADKVTCFSNSNAETDLMAPGAWLTSTGAGGGQATFAGTSQATPMVAGCAALMLEAEPALSADDVHDALISSSSVTVTDPKNMLDFPRLDCAAAVIAVPEPGLGVQLAAGLCCLAALARRARRAQSGGRRVRRRRRGCRST